MLKGCKRLKSQEGTDKLYNIKHDIFVKHISVDDLIEKYFRCTDDITSLGFKSGRAPTNRRGTLSFFYKMGGPGRQHLYKMECAKKTVQNDRAYTKTGDS